MLLSHTQSRINLAELKAQMVKKLGPEVGKLYFYHLNRFLNLKLSKVEFNKVCLRVLGRENIPLHNQLIRSILRNACTAKIPPPVSHKDDFSKHGTQVSGKEISADGYQSNGPHTVGSPGLANGGDILPVSPRKARSNFRDRRSGDRRSALARNGKTSFAPQLSKDTQSSDINIILDNVDLNSPDTVKPVQHHQGLMHQARNENEILSAVQMSPDTFDPAHRKDKNNLIVKNSVKGDSERSPLQAPLGVPFCPASSGGACRALPIASSSLRIGASSDGTLFDSLTLRERMEQIAMAHGLGGVSVDCANVLNNGLDSYMKRIIRSCVEFAGITSRHVLINDDSCKHLIYTQPINGVLPGHQYQMPNTGLHLEGQDQKIQCPVSLGDFRVAMELNPQQLGEDWPLLLEKISMQTFEE